MPKPDEKKASALNCKRHGTAKTDIKSYYVLLEYVVRNTALYS